MIPKMPPHLEKKVFIPNKEFDDMLLEHVKNTKEYYEKNPTRQVPPTLVIEYIDMTTMELKRGSVAIVFPIFEDDRHEIMEKAGRKFIQENHHYLPVAIYLISEIWMSGAKTKDAKDIKMPIRDNPMKTEGVMVSGLSMDKRTNCYISPILRGNKKIKMLHGEQKHLVSEKSDFKLMESPLLGRFFRGVALEYQNQGMIK